MENCLHGCFPGNVASEIFLKTVFIDYLQPTAFIDNDEITQATRIRFLKQSLKTDTGGGDLFKCIVDSRRWDKKFTKYLVDHFLKYSVTTEQLNLPDTNCEFILQ